MIWDSLLKGLGSILSFFYEVIPSYGVAIILLTILVRIVLIPLTIKQTRSMQEMQRIQPKVKELQRKYKGNRQKMNEELMKLYKEHQVNPLGGCLPLLLQLPVFFALFSVLNTPVQAAAVPVQEFTASALPDGAVCFAAEEPSAEGDSPTEIVCEVGDEERRFEVSGWVNKDTGVAIEEPLPFMRVCQPADADPEAGREEDGFLCNSPPGAEHVPRDGGLFEAIVEDRATFLGIHLSCSPTQAASEENVRLCAGSGTGAGVIPAIPYFVLVALMVLSTWYQQRQMQRASGGPAAQQAQLMARIMPIFLGVISISISAGVLVYWVTTNGWQIGQQHFMLRGRIAEAAAAEKPKATKSPQTDKPAPAKSRGNGVKARKNAGSRKKRRKR
ncbi:MAG: YidC/Oxa1 family membrane protein insertase [Pseudonocardiaceae bacterium]